ncbi:MAG: hypothetical protein JWP81_3830 [Ferruginibacter sp.]|nr:hypothetical protein [Ferruginibacter sp.]
MNKKLILLAYIILNSMILSAQKLSVVVNYVTGDGTNNSNIIFYQPGKLLSWDDFKGKSVEASDAAALTNAGFGVKLMFRSIENTSQLVISVSCSFAKRDSWVKPGNKTPYILNHEQKHFDIAFIHTRQFIRNLRKADFTNSNYAALIEKIYNQTAAELTEVQDRYDAETSHSRIPQKQSEWDEKISGQLALAIKE